ncbi:MAG: bifunctional diaminohydroxyphosphoribosylaminopyrimidine deaminase/5-amino-6-(5-phosphoribosylamino)uracil reductase RibD [Terriglobales bacterium]
MSDRSIDELYLRQALALAAEGTALTSPNPSVGAVIVDAFGNVVGSGFHTYSGLKHAEILALEQAGEKAKGATLYINLEPCNHQGRTGPCTEAIIAAGVRRVVASMKDPNPLVSGKGFERLRGAGISVASEILEDEATPLKESFAKYIRCKTPLITLKAGMTLDGKIAPPKPETHIAAEGRNKNPRTSWITGERSRAYVQELRHHQDAILVGIGTVVADDPLLTDRTGRPRRRPLMRVILDSHLRLPLDSRIVKTAAEDVLVICSFAEENKKQKLRDAGVRVEQIPLIDSGGRPNFPNVAKLLGELEITSLIIEGGALVNWAALESGVVDKVFLFYAPVILGGSSVPLVGGIGFSSLESMPHVKVSRLYRFGEDFAVEGYLRDPYGD